MPHWRLVFALSACTQGPIAAPPSLGTLTQPIEGVRRREVGEAVALAPGQTVTLLNTDRAGTLVRLWITLDEQDADPFSLRSARLEARWDGADQPAIRVPLGDFFGAGHGVGGELVSEPVTVLGRGLTSY